jgi:hypothetical protein
MVNGGHREHGTEIAEIAEARRVLRPVLGRLSGEVVDEHHPQLNAAVGVQPAAGRLDGRAASVIEYAGVVGDIAG